MKALSTVASVPKETERLTHGVSQPLTEHICSPSVLPLKTSAIEIGAARDVYDARARVPSNATSRSTLAPSINSENAQTMF
jgi:hypothetical protein